MAHNRPTTDQKNGISICAARAEPLKSGANSICEGVRKNPVAEGESVELVKMPWEATVGSWDVLLQTEVKTPIPHSALVVEAVTKSLLSHCRELCVMLRAV
jgi:hypothetical protein